MISSAQPHGKGHKNCVLSCSGQEHRSYYCTHDVGGANIKCRGLYIFFHWELGKKVTRFFLPQYVKCFTVYQSHTIAICDHTCPTLHNADKFLTCATDFILTVSIHITP